MSKNVDVIIERFIPILPCDVAGGKLCRRGGLHVDRMLRGTRGRPLSQFAQLCISKKFGWIERRRRNESQRGRQSPESRLQLRGCWSVVHISRRTIPMARLSNNLWRDSRNAARKFAGYGLACLVAIAACSAIFLAAPRTPMAPQATSGAQPRFAVSFGSELSATPLDGRVYAVISTNNNPEPRFQIREVEVESQQVFGADVNGLAPGANAIIGDDALGYPTASFHNLPAGDYWVQGVLNKYTTFKRADGHIVKLPM